MKRLIHFFLGPMRWLWLGVSGKTSWEWLELLIIPLLLGVGAFYLENRVEQRQERTATERYEKDRLISEEREKQEGLNLYLATMQGLLLDQDLRSSSKDSEVRSVARAITVTGISALDHERNSLLIRFLREASLIGNGSTSGDATESASLSLLTGLDLEAAQLEDVDLSNADLSETNFGRADFTRANLSSANLTDAQLSEAIFQEARLSQAILLKAELSKANFKKSILYDTNFRNAQLEGVNFNEANLLGADLSNADLTGADLTEANLAGTNFRNAKLRGVILTNADLSGANLSNADLSDSNITESQIRQSILCNTKAPEVSNIDLDRNCSK